MSVDEAIAESLNTCAVRVVEELGVKKEDMLAKDLFLVNRQSPAIWGYKDEFVSAPKLDDLQCAFASLKAFLNSSNDETVSVYCCFDNEEVGSNTKQGAMSTFLHDVLWRISSSEGRSQEDYYKAVAGSFLVSCDNAHAVHPNHPEKTDPVNCVFINNGVVIKESANQKYTTDAFSRAVFSDICHAAGVPVQCGRFDSGEFVKYSGQCQCSGYGAGAVGYAFQLRNCRYAGYTICDRGIDPIL